MPGSIFQLLAHSRMPLSFVACDLVRLLVLVSRSRRALAAENLFLRNQLALFQERKLKPHRAHDSTRLIMVILCGPQKLNPGALHRTKSQLLGERACDIVADVTET